MRRVGKKATISTRMRRKAARPGEVSRDAGGNVTMIDFLKFEANKDAPAIFVNSVAGVYSISENNVQVIFVVRLRDPESGLEHRQVVSLIWDEQDWLASRKLFAFAMAEWERTKKGDGPRKRVMQASMN
jgi:hypothetical protein